MQITRKEDLEQELSLHLKERKLALRIPSVQGQQPDLQRLHPSMQESECRYHQIRGHK